jgi:hypothetical protein
MKDLYDQISDEDDDGEEDAAASSKKTDGSKKDSDNPFGKDLQADIKRFQLEQSQKVVEALGKGVKDLFDSAIKVKDAAKEKYLTEELRQKIDQKVQVIGSGIG